LGYSH
jgi:Leucine-rich repeat (LRR) protein